MSDFAILFCIAYTLIDLTERLFKRIPEWLAR